MADVDVLIREVEIPAVDDHAGLRSVRVQLIWECPTWLFANEGVVG